MGIYENNTIPLSRLMRRFLSVLLSLFALAAGIWMLYDDLRPLLFGQPLLPKATNDSMTATMGAVAYSEMAADFTLAR